MGEGADSVNDELVGNKENREKGPTATIWDSRLKRISLVLGLLLTLFGVIGYLRDWSQWLSGDEQDHIVISGEVFNQSEVPVVGAVVSVDGYPDFKPQSRKYGKFSEKLLGAEVGDAITIRVKHSQYRPFTDDKTLQSANQFFRLILKPKPDTMEKEKP